MALLIKIHYQDGTQESKYLSLHFYEELKRTGMFMGKQVMYFKNQSGDIYDCILKKWSNGTAQSVGVKS